MRIVTPLVLPKVFDDPAAVVAQMPRPDGPDGRWQRDFKRWDVLHPAVDAVGAHLEPLARRAFGSSTLLSSYSVFVRYEGAGMNLPKHVDKNACTYTLDVCMSHSRSWGLWIESCEYVMNPNEAVCYLGERQEHWREQRPDAGDWLELLLCHYVEPDHWWWSRPQ